MSDTRKLKSQEELFQAKAERRRDLAALPVEEKFEMLIKLQQMASAVAKQAGREYKKPWDVKVTAK